MHTTNLLDSDYKTALQFLHENVKHPDRMSELIQTKVLPRIQNKGSFLDIGCGPGGITKKISPFFKDTSVVEPNAEYAKELADNGYSIVNKKFEDVSFTKRYDFVLLSHVLYHVERNHWADYILKMRELVAHGGCGVIALFAPVGPIHYFFKKVNPDYNNSSHIAEILNREKIPYFIETMRYESYTKTFQEMYSLCKFFLLEDCLPHGSYQRMSDRSKKDLENLLSDFVWTLKQPDGGFLVFEDHDSFVVDV